MADKWRNDVMTSVLKRDCARLKKLLNHTNKEPLNFVTAVQEASNDEFNSGQRRKIDHDDYQLDPFEFAWNSLLKPPRSTPLIVAAREGYDEIAKLLLHAGSDANFSDETDCKPLIEAIKKDNTACCQLLLHHGAEGHPGAEFCVQVTATSDYIRQYTVAYFEECLKFDKSSCALIHTNVSPIIEAIFTGSSRILQLLFDHCEKLNMNLPLELFFCLSLDRTSQECAIEIIKRGYYPVNRSLTPDTSTFEEAEDLNFFLLMSLMVELNPQFTYEIDEWYDLQDQLPSNEQTVHQHFVSWLLEYGKQVRSLTKLCKSTILAHLSPHFTRKIKDLRLPESLKAFLQNIESTYSRQWSIACWILSKKL